MGKFFNDLCAKCLDDDDWRLIEPLRFDSDILGPVEAPIGFRTDFASVPRLPLAFLIAGDTAHKAAVIHDWLYWKNGCTRKQADEVFYEAMLASGIATWRAKLMYSAVRAGAWVTWNKYRRQNV